MCETGLKLHDMRGRRDGRRPVALEIAEAEDRLAVQGVAGPVVAPGGPGVGVAHRVGLEASYTMPSASSESTGSTSVESSSTNSKFSRYVTASPPFCSAHNYAALLRDGLRPPLTPPAPPWSWQR